jgi:hypothetical protein
VVLNTVVMEEEATGAVAETARRYIWTGLLAYM